MKEPPFREIEPYFFDLPPELIAGEPVSPPDSCRLMTLGPQPEDEPGHHTFSQLPQLLEAGDLLVFNDTAVEARRVFLRRSQVGRNGQKGEGARVESVFLKRVSLDSGPPRHWQVLIKKRARLRDGEILTTEKGAPNKPLEFEVLKKEDGRTYLLEPLDITPQIFDQIGQMPIPPYLKREEREQDRTNYQNPFAKNPGSAAAPTAALHFTPHLVQALKAKGVHLEFLTLHVGYGTFAPLKPQNLETKKLHPEEYFIPETLAALLAKKEYNRLIVVGTTALRAIETAARKSQGKYNSHLQGETDIFIFPPDPIYSADALITNFHLPGSSLLMLCSSLAGRPILMEAYRQAVAMKYRFFSYGDAMLLFNNSKPSPP